MVYGDLYYEHEAAIFSNQMKYERGIESIGFDEAILSFYYRKMKYSLGILRLQNTKGHKPVMYSEEDAMENIDDYINGTDNQMPNDDVDEQQSFFVPPLTQQDTETTIFQEQSVL